MIRNHSAILRGAMFERVVTELIAGYPLERGAFLVGEMPQSNRDIFSIQGVIVPEHQDGNKDTWYLYHKDLQAAQIAAASEGKRVVGFTHTHPWEKPLRWFTCQSHEDARIQTQFQLAVSMVIGCTGDGSWSFDCWQDRHAAPLYVKIADSKGELFTITQWRKRKTQRKSLWEKYVP